MSAPSIDYYTARPILELLLAQQELEAPDLPLEETLEVFHQFLLLPYDGTDEGGRFRALLTSEGPDGGALTVNLARRMHGPPTYVEVGRVAPQRDVCIEWEYRLEDTGDLQTELLWARDFASLDDFVTAIQSSSAWQLALQTPADAQVLVREPGEEPW
jgi:hypothetical protein